MNEVLVQVRAAHFVAGIVFVDGVARRAAPILRWAVGMTEADARHAFRTRGYKAFVVQPGAPCSA